MEHLGRLDWVQQGPRRACLVAPSPTWSSRLRSSHKKPGHYFCELLLLASLALVSIGKVDTDPEVDSPVALGKILREGELES